MSRLQVVQVLILLCAVPDAFAYVDPGSGMLIWQGLIAAIGIALGVIRRPWAALRQLIDRFHRK